MCEKLTGLNHIQLRLITLSASRSITGLNSTFLLGFVTSFAKAVIGLFIARKKSIPWTLKD